MVSVNPFKVGDRVCFRMDEPEHAGYNMRHHCPEQFTVVHTEGTLVFWVYKGYNDRKGCHYWRVRSDEGPW